MRAYLPVRFCEFDISSTLKSSNKSQAKVLEIRGGVAATALSLGILMAVTFLLLS